MKQRSLREMIQAKERIERGDETPAAAWEVTGKGSTPRKLEPKSFQRAQKAAWNRSVAGTREKLGLTQQEFARLLGISIRTLHHWEQGTRKPTGAARVLLRIAASHPKTVLQAAA